MAHINPLPLADELTDRLGPVVSNDRGRDVFQAQAVAEDQVFNQCFINQRATVDFMQYTPERDGLAKLGSELGNLVMYVPENVHGVPYESGSCVCRHWPGPCHADRGVLKGLEEPGQRARREYNIPTQDDHKWFGRLKQQLVEGARLARSLRLNDDPHASILCSNSSDDQLRLIGAATSNHEHRFNPRGARVFVQDRS